MNDSISSRCTEHVWPCASPLNGSDALFDFMMADDMSAAALNASDAELELAKELEMYAAFLKTSRFWVQRVLVPLIMAIGVVSVYIRTLSTFCELSFGGRVDNFDANHGDYGTISDEIAPRSQIEMFSLTSSLCVNVSNVHPGRQHDDHCDYDSSTDAQFDEQLPGRTSHVRHAVPYFYIRTVIHTGKRRSIGRR